MLLWRRREKHSQHAKQREQAEAELLEAQQQYHQQQQEIMLLERATARMRTLLPRLRSTACCRAVRSRSSERRWAARLLLYTVQIGVFAKRGTNILRNKIR